MNLKRYGLPLAFGLLLFTNIWVIGGVVYNRSGEPDTRITLTERELPTARQDRENTGLFLRLEWQMPGFQKPGHYNPESSWFTENKVRDLGFRVDVPATATRAYDYYSHQLPRTAFIVLEMEGPAWQDWRRGAAEYYATLKADLAQETDPGKKKTLTRQIDDLKRKMVTQTRLFAVNVGPDAEALRSRYPDRTRYIIARGIVRTRLTYLYQRNDAESKTRTPVISGFINQILVDQLHIPHLFRDRFLTLISKPRYWNNATSRTRIKNGMGPRYAVTLNYGRRYEPWITDLQELR
ncbi:DUF4824 family protein [Nitrospina watsonii]|uniref:DUF4824 family protein n=1 Tax=Nitrospina watsonii TaxID=1323948 RepID=A0ABM9HDR0_9BACT|nr:DUF4824 family protein [Nitrospina watsonii]CAI2718353.1 conserved protein of unknown function [Nitrospina watsonii]